VTPAGRLVSDHHFADTVPLVSDSRRSVAPPLNRSVRPQGRSTRTMPLSEDKEPVRFLVSQFSRDCKRRTQ
jgi:hypothetical protein